MSGIQSIAAGFLLIGLLATHPATLHAEMYPPLVETPIILEASQFLPADIMEGSNYSIEKSVTNDGFINTYTINTPNGRINVETTPLLRARINELQAMEDMQAMKGTDIFTESLKKGAKAPINTVKGLVTEPVDTVSNVASGIGRWFSDVGRSIYSDDPYQDNVLKTAFGYSAVKRKYAYQFDIDPYTSYEPVQKEITSVSKAAFAGGIVPKAAFSAINKTAGTVLSVTATADSMKKMVRDNSPAELADINEEKLQDMDVPQHLIKSFLGNRHFNPYETTLLVGELESMVNVADREKFISDVITADSDLVASFLRLEAQMMASYHHKISPGLRIVDVDGKISFLQIKDKTMVAFLPLDYVASTINFWEKESLLSRSLDKIGPASGKQMWITGAVTPDARKGLEMRGWKVMDNAAKKLFR